MRNIRMDFILPYLLSTYNVNKKICNVGCKLLKYRDIGKQIKIERIKQDLTQEQLAEKAAISVSHLSGIERGTTKLGLAAFCRIANALKISTDILLCYSVDNQTSKAVLADNIAIILSDCNKNEMVFLEEILRSSKDSIKKYSEKIYETQ